jgi:type II secretory pathway pseudopilin PulG
MNTNSRNGRAAFTLIELMAVITIIIILAGLVVGGMGFVTERQAKEKAKTQVALLSKAIEEYKLDMGKYPGTTANTGGTAGTNVSDQLYKALFYEGYELSKNPNRTDNPTNPKASKIYLPELDPRSSKQGWVTSVTSGEPPASTTIMDPWGQPYRYRTGKDAQNPDFDLWSIGKDGKSQTGNTDSQINHRENKDDVRNF